MNIVKEPLLETDVEVDPTHWFHDISTKYVLAQIYFSLNQVGVVSLLARQTQSGKQLADSLFLDEHTLVTLLDYARGVDVVFEKNDDGKYALTYNGSKIVRRFSDPANTESVNMFDVRVGCYGPVWAGLESMLSGAASYGDGIERNGKYAEKGVGKLSRHFWPVLERVLGEQSPELMVEVGLYSGLMALAHDQHKTMAIAGLDRKPQSLEEAAKLTGGFGEPVKLVQADFNDFDRWVMQFPADKKVQLVSLHFHEVLANGYDRLKHTMARISSERPKWSVLIFEKPLPSEDDVDKASVGAMYAHSNVLIHHLVGNGVILSDERWLELGEEAGFAHTSRLGCDYLGYNGYLYKN